MLAYQLHAIGDLRLCDGEMPQLDEASVLVRTAACGVCSSDIPRIFENGTYHFPTVPGHEFAGTVEAAGGEAGKAWIGKRVGVFPLIPCKECDQCAQRRYEMCRNYDYLGSRSDGGFAEFVKVPVWNLIELPDNVAFDQAAMLEPLCVARHAAKTALRGGGNMADLRIAVVGTGAIGMFVACWLRQLGCLDVSVIGRNEHKRALADALGLPYVNGSSDDGAMRYDILVEAVGSVESVIQCIELANAGARIVLMGNPAGDMNLPRTVYWKILRSQLTLKGVWNSSYESSAPSEWSEAVEALSEGTIDVMPLITHRFAFKELPAALDMMRSGGETYGKVMVVFK